MGERKPIVILGPTASGKTKLAVQLAHHLHGEIISADSRQVYKKLNIGTGKDLEEYTIKGNDIPYHLIDIKEAGKKYNVHEFQIDFEDTLNTLNRSKTQAIICGGTGFYIEAALKGFPYAQIPINEAQRCQLLQHSKEDLIEQYSPLSSYFPNVDFHSKKRIIRAFEIAQYIKENGSNTLNNTQTDATIIGIYLDRETRRERITKRLKKRFEEGMTDEVEDLLQDGVSADELVYYGLEYKLITEHLLQKTSFEALFLKLEVAIHQYAKRQMTYFRKLEKDGFTINWIDGKLSLEEQLEAALQLVKP